MLNQAAINDEPEVSGVDFRVVVESNFGTDEQQEKRRGAQVIKIVCAFLYMSSKINFIRIVRAFAF